MRDLTWIGTNMLILSGWPLPQDGLLRTLFDACRLVSAMPAHRTLNGKPGHPFEFAHRAPFCELLRQWVVDRDGRREAVDIDG